MAKQSIPYALDMRRIKYGEASDSELVAVAKALRAQGRHAEVILLFERRPDHQMLVEEANDAAQAGRSFDLLACRRIGVAVTEAQLRSCAAKAMTESRFLEAYHCFVALDDSEAIENIADKLPTRLQPDTTSSDE